jgi:DNA/RNA-binding domain of Phe-tRNA-synthetase-like protein
MVTVTEAWRTTYPNAHLGTLAMSEVNNPAHHAELEKHKRDFEEQLREQFQGQSRADLAVLPTMQAYRAYYKNFRKTYHVLLQLRSVVLEQKPIPSVAALVEAVFMAELKSFLLTAVHDLDLVQEPITLDVARGDEKYILLNGREQMLKPQDMYMSDAGGVICSVIYGSDLRTAIRPETKRAFFVVYAPEGVGIDAIKAHMEGIRKNVRLVSPQAVTDEFRVYGHVEPTS